MRGLFSSSVRASQNENAPAAPTFDAMAKSQTPPRRTLVERLRGVSAERKLLQKRLADCATQGTLGEEDLGDARSSDLLASGLHASQLWSREIGIRAVAERSDQHRKGIGGKAVPCKEMPAEEAGTFLRSFGLHRHPELCEQEGGSWSVAACLCAFASVSEAALRDELGLPHTASTSSDGGAYYAASRAPEGHSVTETPDTPRLQEIHEPCVPTGSRAPSPPPTQADWEI